MGTGGKDFKANYLLGFRYITIDAFVTGLSLKARPNQKGVRDTFRQDCRRWEVRASA